MIKNSVVWFLARQITFGKNNSYIIKSVTWICFAAIMIGSMALTLILAIMQGFETTTTERLQSIYPQIIIQAPIAQNLNWSALSNYLKQNNQILAYTPYAISYGVLHNPKLDAQLELQNICLIKAIDQKTELLVSQLATKLSPNNLLSNQTLAKNQVIIGSNLASNLNLEITNPVEIFIPSEANTKNKSLNFKKVKASMIGTIKTGISEFDDSLIICPLEFAQEHFHEFGINEIGVKLKPKINPDLMINKLKTDLNLNIITWQELYAPIITALKLEKYTGIAIAILIILIASMTLIALLFMLITRHARNIAVLQILGLSITKIKHIFILISLMITSLATVSGILIASLIGLIIQNYHFIELPEAYLVTTLPINLSWQIFAFVLTNTLLIALFICILPLNLVNKINLAKLLKIND